MFDLKFYKMLTKKVFTVVLVALFATMGTLVAQEKYAIIIGGNMNPGSSIPATEQWNGGQNPGPYGFDEIWNDLYLAWEMLINEDFGKGYDVDNVHVLFGNGSDFWFNDQNTRYQAGYNGQSQVVDENSNKQTIINKFGELATTVTADDFLFVWIMGHGGSNPFQGGYFYSYDGQKVYASQLNTLLDNIQAHKKVVYLSFPKSGAFASQLEDNGIIVVTSSGATEGASRADDLAPDPNNPPTQPFIENEVRNNISYHHGEINYHFTAALTGFTPLPDDQYAGIDLSAADVDSDNFVDINECFNWITTYETASQTPVCSDLDGIKPTTGLTYPTLLHFDLLYPSTICRGQIGVSKDVTLNMSSLIFLDNSKIYFLNEGTELEAGNITTLTIGERCEFTGTGNTNLITITTGCDITIGDYVKISVDQPTKKWEIGIQNEDWPIEMNHVEISNTILDILSGTFELKNSSFNSVYFIHQYGITSLQIDSTTFTDASLSIYDGKPEITNCQFSNTLQGTVWAIPDYLRIITCPEFTVSGNSLNNAGGNGISIFYSGDMLGDHLLTNNTINYCGQFSSSDNGIFCYNSYVDIIDNVEVAYNQYGIISLNNSTVKLLGNKYADYVHQTQQIHDNSINQVYATAGAFPYEFRFNAVYDNDNTCLVKYVNDPQGTEPNLDVSYNYWGTGFDPQTDLCPTGLYTWNPLWNLQFQNPATENDELLFTQAGILADSGQYTQANSKYVQLVNQYPGSDYTTAALKEMYIIENVSAGNYTLLNTYYASVLAQNPNTQVGKTADFLSNLCDIEMGNYSKAITWYEDVIQDPPTFEDSLFAIIDLGNLYLKIENDSLKSAPIGAMTEYKPQSVKQYTENREYLISLLFKGEETILQAETDLSDNKSARLLQNIPNPCVGNTTLNYELMEDAIVVLNIYDYSGKLVKILDEGNKEAGKHSTTFFAGELNAGIYFCTIKCNGIISDSQKITIIN